MLSLPDIRPGDPMRAEHLLALYAAVRALELTVAAPLEMAPGGAISLNSQGAGMWIRLTSASGPAFAWTRVFPAAGGGWDDDTLSGTIADDPAVELNGNTAVGTLPLVVRAWRAPTNGQVYYQAGACS